MKLSELSIVELLRLNAETIEELRRREVLTTSNAILGDYAERLFRKAYGWIAAGNSARDFDATDTDDVKYLIKSHRTTRRNGSRQLGALRGIDERNFDILAAAPFNEDFSVLRGALIPFETVQQEASRVERTNSWRFMLRDHVWNLPGVIDCPRELKQAQKAPLC